MLHFEPRGTFRAASSQLFALTLFAALAASASSTFAEVSVADLRKYKQQLAEAVQKKSADRLEALIGRVASEDDPKILEILLDAAILVPSARNYDAAVKAVATYKNEATVQELVKLSAKSKDFRHRVLILEAFGSRKDAISMEGILSSLSDKVIHAQVAAIEACVRRKQKEAVPALIDLIEREEKSRSRAWIEGREALLALTNQDFETIEDWRKFWDGAKETLDPTNLDRSQGPTKVVVKKTDDSVEFFGKEIFSSNVVFVVDCSGSMIVYKNDPDYVGANIKHDMMRLTRAKAQTLNAVRKLKRGSKFNVITYSDRVVEWQKGIVAATTGNFASARKFIDGFKAEGPTHTDEGLEKAFQDPYIDTIVLLSDGAPARQDTPDSLALMEKILERVKDLNASRKLTINTFGFEDEATNPQTGQTFAGGGDSDPMVKFLKELAERNGGSYQEIK